MRPLLLLLFVACNDVSSPKPLTPPAKPAPIAAPEHPTLPTTTVSWSMAEADPTPTNWDAAGDAIASELAQCTAHCFDLAKREILARKNAMIATGEIYAAPDGDAPTPVPPRVAALVKAIDDYVKLADPADSDGPKYAFIAASTMYRYRQPDAIARCEAILRDHRDAEIAEYAANELLDLLSRANQTSDLRFWVNELSADAQFLDGKDALRETLQQLRTRLDSPS